MYISVILAFLDQVKSKFKDPASKRAVEYLLNEKYDIADLEEMMRPFYAVVAGGGQQSSIRQLDARDLPALQDLLELVSSIGYGRQRKIERELESKPITVWHNFG